MKETIVRLAECKSGMVLARDVFNQNGVAIIAKDTVLEDNLIDRLAVMYIDNIYIIVDDDYKTSEEISQPEVYIYENFKAYLPFEEVKEEYKKKAKSVQNIFENIIKGGEITKANDLAISITESNESVGDILRCMSQVKEMDEFIYYHCLNVASVCNLIGEWMNLKETELKDLVLAGLLHDVGKTKIPKELFKATELTSEKQKMFEQHSILGYEMVKKIPNVSKEVCDAVLMHHEKEDGSGFPSELKGDKIPLFAKIISVANIYSTITLDRVYKRTDTPFVVFKLFESAGGKKFDPLVTYVLIKNLAQFYLGSMVKLSNGDEGKIIFIDDEFVSRPVIELKNKSILDLKEKPEIAIVKGSSSFSVGKLM